MSDLQIVDSREKYQANLGKVVRVVGIYEQLNVNMNKFDDPIYRGNVCLRFPDKMAVAIEPVWSSSGIRPPDEIKKFEGKRVEVVGKIYPATAGGQGAQLMIPAVTEIQSIDLFN